MVKYIYDMSKLRYGDIILVRFPGDSLSDRVRESTNSEYSHAMLYVDDSSYIEASDRVVARNLARLLFDDTSDTCVLRVKEEFLKPYTIDAAIYYARDVVGNPYAAMDALRLEAGRIDNHTSETQICTRLVAKAYAKSGLYLVDNIEMCTPQQIQDSRFIEVKRDYLREARDFDKKFAASYDVTTDMVNAIFRLFDMLKPFANGSLRTMRQLIDHVSRHHEDDEPIDRLMKDSGYLDILKIEEEKNKYNYDKEEFIRYYGDDAYVAACSALETNRRGKYRYKQECTELNRLFIANGMNSHFLLSLIALNKQIIEQYELRERVCCEVIEVYRSRNKGKGNYVEL